LRIVSGKFRGRYFDLKAINARPTTDFAKESLFNIINNYFFFDKVKVLDLFSGTGSIGIEFLSRGCSNVQMVEHEQRNIKNISEVLKTLNTQAKLIKADVFKFLENTKETYDIIFADPPYDMEGIDRLPDLIFSRNLLNNEGWFILEHSKKADFKNHQHFHEERSYGSVHFSVFVK
jgi:16S rRNA (guanine(966)-N(2))-methyltransferase RsmD